MAWNGLQPNVERMWWLEVNPHLEQYFCQRFPAANTNVESVLGTSFNALFCILRWLTQVGIVFLSQVANQT